MARMKITRRKKVGRKKKPAKKANQSVPVPAVVVPQVVKAVKKVVKKYIPAPIRGWSTTEDHNIYRRDMYSKGIKREAGAYSAGFFSIRRKAFDKGIDYFINKNKSDDPAENKKYLSSFMKIKALRNISADKRKKYFKAYATFFNTDARFTLARMVNRVPLSSGKGKDKFRFLVNFLRRTFSVDTDRSKKSKDGSISRRRVAAFGSMPRRIFDYYTTYELGLQKAGSRGEAERHDIWRLMDRLPERVFEDYEDTKTRMQMIADSWQTKLDRSKAGKGNMVFKQYVPRKGRKKKGNTAIRSVARINPVPDSLIATPIAKAIKKVVKKYKNISKGLG